MFISNGISNYEMSFEIKHIIKHNFRLELTKFLSILSFNAIYLYAYKKKECISEFNRSDKLASILENLRKQNRIVYLNTVDH